MKLQGMEVLKLSRRWNSGYGGQMLNAITIILFFFVSNVFAKEVHYTLQIAPHRITVSGKSYEKLTVNGQTPGPLLEFTEGDMAFITVINKMKKNTTVHWHGLLLPNEMDGVPYVNQMPIKPGESKLYKFPLIQNGTYWYHSHVMFQEQDGIFGAFVIHPKAKRELDYDEEQTIVLSDFTEESGETVHRNLKKDGDYYKIKKNYVQSWWKAFKTGTAGTKFYNSLQRMMGMDYADVAYDHFLANGKPVLSILENSSSKKKIKLRIINGSASSIFKLTYGNGPITIIGNDGTDIVPVEVDILPIGTAETYDILVDVENHQKAELRVTSIDNSGASHIFIGQGTEALASQMPWKVPMSMTMGNMMRMEDMGFWRGFAMSYQNEYLDFLSPIKREKSDYQLPEQMNLGKMKMDHSHMKMPAQEFNYEMARAIEPFEIKEKQKLLTYKFTLNGNMENYIWSINGTPIGPESYILIKKGYRIRFVMKNTTMMNHPMHLHGHFFRVMTKNGYYSPKKHTVIVGPLKTQIIEFDATEERDWFFHCHLLYHMMDGMTRIVRYEDKPGDTLITEARKDSKEFNYTSDYFLSTKILAQTSYTRLEGKYFNSWYMAKYSLESNYDGNSESEIHLSNILTRFLTVYVGGRMESDDYAYHGTPTLGLTWKLPLNIDVDLKYQLNQQMDQYELEFENSIQLTTRGQLNFRYSSIRDWLTELEIRHNKHLSSVISYHRLYENYGIGLGYTY